MKAYKNQAASAQERLSQENYKGFEKQPEGRKRCYEAKAEKEKTPDNNRRKSS